MPPVEEFVKPTKPRSQAITPPHRGPATDGEKDRYRRALRAHRLGKYTEPIANLRPWHCKAAVEELLLLAVEMQERRPRENPVIIRILTGCLPDYVYAEADFDAFVEMGGLVRVLIWNENVDVRGHHLFLLSEQHPMQVELRFAHNKLESASINHFLIVDEHGYRLEAIHEKTPVFDDMEPMIPARINFNDPKGARRLADGFDELWGQFSNVHRSKV